jgi:hypothetical protein
MRRRIICYKHLPRVPANRGSGDVALECAELDDAAVARTRLVAEVAGVVSDEAERAESLD